MNVRYTTVSLSLIEKLKLRKDKVISIMTETLKEAGVKKDKAILDHVKSIMEVYILEYQLHLANAEMNAKRILVNEAVAEYLKLKIEGDR